jgi:hypothetical protein
MPHVDVLDRSDPVAEARRALQSGESALAVEGVAERLRAFDPEHDMLLLLDAKIVALLIGLSPRVAN